MEDTARRPFQAKGDEPEWRLIYEAHLAAAEPGDVITYPALDETLGRRFIANRSPLYRAREHLGDTRLRWLEAVPGKGYRVIEASEHLRVAQQHKKRAKRQLGQMVRVGAVTDLSRLDPAQLEHYDAQQRHNVRVAAVLINHENRLARIEGVMRKEGML